MRTFSVPGEQEAKGNNMSINISSIRCLRLRQKKLLILDLNGLLADIVFPPPCHAKADTIIQRKASKKYSVVDYLFDFIIIIIIIVTFIIYIFIESRIYF
jgi:hypothetical protein